LILGGQSKKLCPVSFCGRVSKIMMLNLAVWKSAQRQRIGLLATGWLGLCLVGSLGAAQPNIIFILTDDLGWGDVGVLFQNSRKAANVRSEPWFQTPHLDRFAAEGVQLPNHYCAAPVCAPSRASILLGVSQGHANVRDNQFDKALEANHTLATVLRQAGYATVAVGKWGLQGEGPGEDSPATWPAFPTKRGFDQFFGYARHKDGHEHYPKEAPHFKGQSREVWHDSTNVTPALDKCYTADLWTAWAKHWIVAHQRVRTNQPFFMYLAYDTPHATTELPTQPYPGGGGLHGGLQWLGTPGHMINTASGQVDSWIHPDYRDATYDDDQNPATPEVAWPEVYQRYATAVRRLDDAVGDLQQLLQDLKIDQDTLVVFTSDNGPSVESYLPQNLRADFFNDFGPFDGIKRDCLEGGVRVPTFVRWPGHVPAGKVVTSPSIGYDWLRTFADAAGVPAPMRADGISLLPELTGQGVPPERGYLYIEYFEGGKTPNYQEFNPEDRGRKRGQMQTIRMGDYVGLRYNVKSPSDPFEIYKVTADPGQTNDLAPELRSLQQRMQMLVPQVRYPNATAPRPYDDELVAAVPAVTAGSGVEWLAFDGDYPWVPDFTTLKSVARGVADQPDPGRYSRSRNFGLGFSGYLKVPQDGEYTFYLTADTGAMLRIHDTIVVDADYGYPCGTEISGRMKLQAGLHPFRLGYVHRTKEMPALDFSWSGPDLPKEKIPASAFRQAAAAGSPLK
jgi:arylsulfatase A-like enzyme